MLDVEVIPKSRVLIEKLIVVKLVKKFPAFYAKSNINYT
jgi:hypothetical protein